MIRFHFEDRGQDCLWWDVEENDTGIAKIIDANLQAWHWADGQHFVSLCEPHREGANLTFTDDLERSLASGYSLRFKQRVVNVEHFRLGGSL